MELLVKNLIFTGLVPGTVAGLVPWLLAGGGPLAGGGGWYYQTIKDATDNDGVTYELLDVLARDVGVIGVFSDWPATTTFYANCMGFQ